MLVDRRKLKFYQEKGDEKIQKVRDADGGEQSGQRIIAILFVEQNGSFSILKSK